MARRPPADLTAAGPAPLATLLHGFTGSAEAWGRAVPACLVAAGYRHRAVDLPGHGARRGEVDPTAFTLEATLGDVRSSMLGSGHVSNSGALIGYSMGGRVALHVAHRYPELVSCLVLESASPGLASPEERAQRVTSDEALARALESDGIHPFVDGWEALPLFASQVDLDEGTRRALRARRLANDPSSLAASLRGLGAGRPPSLWDDLASIEVPTLVLVGARDEKFVRIGERMAERMPRAYLHVVDGAGHTVHLERPDAWCEAVEAFLRAG